MSNIDKGVGAQIDSVFAGEREEGEGREEGASTFLKKIQIR